MTASWNCLWLFVGVDIPVPKVLKGRKRIKVNIVPSLPRTHICKSQPNTMISFIIVKENLTGLCNKHYIENFLSS